VVAFLLLLLVKSLALLELFTAAESRSARSASEPCMASAIEGDMYAAENSGEAICFCHGSCFAAARGTYGADGRADAGAPKGK
jgi:hypothetical protein